MPSAKEKQEKKFIFNSKNVQEITDQINDGYIIKRFQNPWFKNEVGVRRSNLTFSLIDDEIQEYIKCKLDIHYFAEKYCRVKTEDGSIDNIKLRDYQKKILDLYNGRFSILCGSRQIGKCFSFNTLIELKSGQIYRFGILYYQILSEIRPLNLLEHFKIKLYNLLYRFEGNQFFFSKNLIKILYLIIEAIEKIEYSKVDIDENDINKKILNTISNLNLSVKSDSGWVEMTDIHITQPYRQYCLILSNGYYLNCADNHIVFDENHNEVFVKDLKIGDEVQTNMGLSKVISVENSGFKVSMFDGTIRHKDHRFYTNGILSHNTISASITMLHFITFNNDKNIMIVANIANTAIEIIDKIKSIYIQLPFFLKVGIKNWNQRSIIFDNGCRIKSSARTKTPAIGFTIDFLYMDEFAHIPPNIIEAYYTAAFPTVSAIENSKIIITSTPNGMNLFYKLLTDAEKPEGDPSKSNYRAMRVYWYQVPGRFVTYYRLNDHKMHEYGVTKEQILDQVKEIFGDLTRIEIKFYSDLGKYVILVYNNESCSDQMAKSFQFIDSNGLEVPIQAIAETTTWKEEAIKDIGGEDAFNQEYGLRFINSSRSLLNEATIEELLNNKKNYEWEQIYEFDKKLKFSYKDLKWVDDDNIFMPIQRKIIRGIFSIDISEGLGQDYSIINILKIDPKPKEVIEMQKHAYTNISDFFRLVQIGMFRSNLVSVKQLAEIFYLISFEYFNYDNFKTVLELNNYGNEFLAHLPHVFDGNNNYGSSIFLKYKHRADSLEEKIGLKITDNKNLLVKEYQDAMDKKNFSITNDDNIREITTFVKHITTAGNIRYAADIGGDDSVMTLVNASSVFSKHEFRQMCEDYSSSLLDTETRNYFNLILKEADYSEGTDYSSIINVNRQRKLMAQYKNHVYNNGNQYFGGNYKL